MTKKSSEDWREFKRVEALQSLKTLDELERRHREALAAGRESYASEEWLAYHRRRLERQLAEFAG